MKDIVYVETTVVSYLAGRRSRNTIVAAHQELTRIWWRERGPGFELVVSELVRREASAGDVEAAASRIAAIDDLRILRVTDEAIRLAQLLISKGPVPGEYAEDALHISIAAVNGADYLLTWNCKHLANASHRNIIEAVIDETGCACPIICTPEELMED